MADRVSKGTVWRLKDRILILGCEGNEYIVQEINEQGKPIEQPFRVKRTKFTEYYIAESKILKNAIPF